MKRRVPLYGCSPCAVGTPLVESLTGFVSRLAVARQLPTSSIFEHLVRPLVPEGVVRENLHLTGFLASEAVTYDGPGPSAPSVDRSNPAISGHRKSGHFRRPETGVDFYFRASFERKAVWTLVRQLRGPHLSTWA